MNEHYFNFCNSRYTSADDDLVPIKYPGYLATLNEEIYGTFFNVSYTTQNRELKQLDYIAEPRNRVTNRENSFDYNDSIQRYVVDFNTTLYIEHLIKTENEDENEDGPITCISQIYIADLMMTALPVKDYPSCSDEFCVVPSLKSSNLCNQQSQWLLDKPGNFDIHLNLSISNEGLFNSRIKVYVSEMHRQLNTTEQVLLPETSLTMTSSTFKHSVKGTDNTKVTKQLLVEVSPVPKTKHSQSQLNSCSQISVQVKTNLTFIISSDLNTKYILRINGGIKQNINNTKLSHIFNSVGNFTVEIGSETEAYIFNWTKQITVLEDLSQKVQIDFLPRIAEHSPAIKTLTNVTFFTYVKGECISTPDSLNWEIDNKTLQGESVNVIFDKVGPNVQALPVKIAEFPKLELPINLYDAISNFRVSFADGFKGVFCENTPIVQLGLSQDIGTAVQYFYAEGNSNPIHPIPQNKSISIKSRNIKCMRFRAKNVVSNEEVIKNVEFTDQIVFVFKKDRCIVNNEQVTIRPEKFRACEEYNYRWIVDKTNRNREVGKAHEIPELHDTFSKVETVIVQLTVWIGNVTYNHTINVVVEEEAVCDNKQLKIFTVIDDALVAATENITVAINSEVKFNAGNVTSSENDLGFKWYVDNDEVTDKQDLIHTFEKNGLIVVEVRLVDENSNVLGKSNILVNVVLRLLSVDIHLYNENEKLENNSLITSKNSTKFYLKNVTYTPDDVGHVTVNVTCIRIITNKILYQSTLHLSNFEEISILWLQKGIGEIHCIFITYNIVSKIQTNFRFVFLTSNGSMNFINSPDVVKIDKQVIFTIQLNNNLLPGNLRWAINGTAVGMCFAAITYQKNTTSCEYIFNTLNVFLITVEYQTEYYKLTESFKVRVADPITKVSLVPKIFEVNRPRNLTLKINSCCVLTYLWKEFDSTASLVTFTPKQSGKKNVTVLVSNKISTLTHTEAVTIYPFFTQNNLSIIIGGSKKLAFKINEQASLQSSLYGELINLTWHVTDKNNCRQNITLAQLSLTCAKAGVYTVMLNASTPFRYITDIINITIVAPIGKLTIRPKYIKNKCPSKSHSFLRRRW